MSQSRKNITPWDFIKAAKTGDYNKVMLFLGTHYIFNGTTYCSMYPGEDLPQLLSIAVPTVISANEIYEALHGAIKQRSSNQFAIVQAILRIRRIDVNYTIEKKGVFSKTFQSAKTLAEKMRAKLPQTVYDLITKHPSVTGYQVPNYAVVTIGSSINRNLQPQAAASSSSSSSSTTTTTAHLQTATASMPKETNAQRHSRTLLQIQNIAKSDNNSASFRAITDEEPPESMQDCVTQDVYEFPIQPLHDGRTYDLKALLDVFTYKYKLQPGQTPADDDFIDAPDTKKPITWYQVISAPVNADFATLIQDYIKLKQQHYADLCLLNDLQHQNEYLLARIAEAHAAIDFANNRAMQAEANLANRQANAMAPATTEQEDLAQRRRDKEPEEEEANLAEEEVAGLLAINSQANYANENFFSNPSEQEAFLNLFTVAATLVAEQISIAPRAVFFQENNVNPLQGNVNQNDANNTNNQEQGMFNDANHGFLPPHLRQP